MVEDGQRFFVVVGAVDGFAEEGAAGEKEGKPKDVAEESDFGAAEGKRCDTG